MRTLIAIPLLLAGCSGTGDGPNNSAAIASASNAAQSTQAAGMLGDEPATSPSAQDARKTVEQYFSLIKQRKFREARLLWGNDGADLRGSAEQLAESFDQFARYEPKVGEPTEIKARDGMQYILVAATATVRAKKSPRLMHYSGTVMLKRSADPSETSPDKRSWRIWGVDLRERH